MAKGNLCWTDCVPQCIGMKMLILGILIVLNATYGWFDWGTFVGGIIGIKGILMLIMPVCPCGKK